MVERSVGLAVGVLVVTTSLCLVLVVLDEELPGVAWGFGRTGGPAMSERLAKSGHGTHSNGSCSRMLLELSPPASMRNTEWPSKARLALWTKSASTEPHMMDIDT